MDDLISRQAAIDALNKRARDTFSLADGYQYYLGALHDVADDIKQLPSAQPEIIRCKNCKHRDPEDKKCDFGHDIVWQLPRQDDWYCADAERRTDEADYRKE